MYVNRGDQKWVTARDLDLHSPGIPKEIMVRDPTMAKPQSGGTCVVRACWALRKAHRDIALLQVV